MSHDPFPSIAYNTVVPAEYKALRNCKSFVEVLSREGLGQWPEILDLQSASDRLKEACRQVLAVPEKS